MTRKKRELGKQSEKLLVLLSTAQRCNVRVFLLYIPHMFFVVVAFAKMQIIPVQLYCVLCNL